MPLLEGLNTFRAVAFSSDRVESNPAEVVGTALSDGFKQYSYEERERTLGQIIGTVQGVGDVLQFYATISDFANDIIFRREDRLQERGAKFGEALANTYVAGIALFNLAYDYCYNIGFEGDYYKPFRDVVSVANAIDNKWKSLPPREQERIKAQLITNLLADGVITARYSNGESRPAGQIEIANFRNPQGLQPMGDNAWARTNASGDPVTGVPGDGNLGAIQSGALEESNVDLTGELVNMITAQRIYQANAQTIKTQDQMLSTLVNLR